MIAGAAIGVGSQIAKAIGGAKAKKAARAEEARAKKEMQKQKDAFSKLDTSNPYANMENKMEDLTVNQGEADFMKQQQQESQANIMQQMKGAAGGSGIAALAQTMANQGSMDAQKSAASIGKQEAGNQMAERQAASAIQDQERKGDVMSRDMERNKVSTLLGMSQSEVGAAGEKVASANSQMWSGITGAAGAAAGGLSSMSKAGMFGGGGGASSMLDGATVSGTGLDLSNDQYMSPIEMKGSPLKQADQTLIRGAYRAAMGGQGRGKQNGMAQGMDDLAKIAQEGVAEMGKNRQAAQKKGDDLAQGILDTGGALGTGWLDATRGQVEAMHGDYKNAAAFNKKGKKAKGMQDLNTLSAEIASLKDLNTQIAEWQGPPGEKSDWSNSLNDENRGIINAFMDNDSEKRISMVDGKRVFEVKTPAGWKNSKEIESLAKDSKQDYTNMVGVRKQAIDIVDKAKNDAKENINNGVIGEGYDLVKATAKMDNTLKSANLKSMMHDDVLENGTPFIDAVSENPEIKGMSYEELGMKLNADGVFEIDTDGDGVVDSSFQDVGNDGKISEEEKKTLLESGHKDMIIDALTNPDNEFYNEETTRGMVSSYFTQFIKNQYDDQFKKSGGNTGENSDYNAKDEKGKTEAQNQYL